MNDLKKEIHVSVPFRMLFASYLPRFVDNGLNPEIGFDFEALDRYSFEDFKYVADQLHEHGLAVTFHFPFMDLSPGSPDKRVRELTLRRFEQVIPLVSLFRPKTAVCHTGYDSRRYWFMKDQWLQNSMGLWPPLCKTIAREGCALMLENVYEDTPQDILGLLQGLKDYGAGFCLDTGHQSVFSKAPLEEWVRVLAPHLRQLHLHDNLGEQDDHIAIGRGLIDFKGFFAQLRHEVSAPPLITLEPHREEDVFPSLHFLSREWPWPAGDASGIALNSKPLCDKL